jgi:hypothetical protein
LAILRANSVGRLAAADKYSSCVIDDELALRVKSSLSDITYGNGDKINRRMSSCNALERKAMGALVIVVYPPLKQVA